MIPIRDENPTQTTPYVTYGLLAANLAAFTIQFALMRSGAAWVLPGFGLVPSRVTLDPSGEAFTVLTSMFMHGGWEHLGGNLLFLYIFGDNVEDALGHLRYLLFYALSGVAAAGAQILVDPASPVPMVGASGAIAGVLAAYLVLYPRAPVHVINPILPLWLVFGVLLVFPAWLVVGEWFLWNLIRGVGSLGDGALGGVAFFAHIGGFIAGLLGIKLALVGRPARTSRRWQGFRPPPRSVDPRREPGSRRDPWL
ncbi:MAG: rhomboid family intramembrane serine protease [Polyangiaceae bacterium]|nr:rhomboid family intramembrane serine protease [Polyangiaceae bacterium]